MLTKKLLKAKYKIYLNFSRNNIHYLKIFKKNFKNNNLIEYTYKKSISEIISIIDTTTHVIGNESGPVCIGASLRKKVHSIYCPINTKPESKIITNNISCYNSNLISKNKIIEKILNSIIEI